MTGITPYFVDEPRGLPISGKPANSCLRRQSSLTYKLVNPLNPDSQDTLCYDVGQLKQIFLMDRRLREEGVVRSIPAGYLEFATRFNAFAEGPERFATYQFIKGQYSITASGSPITWECLALDDPIPESSNTHQYHGAGEQERDGFMPAFGFMDGSTNTQLHALSTYMRGVMNTTDELTRFWIKRSAIEQQYASRLADLAETPIGKNELPEIRSAMDSLRMETAKQAMNRFELSKQIVTELEKRCVELQVKQRKHWRETYEPTARKLHQNARVHEKRRRSATIGTEWKQEYKKLRYSLDHHRLESMKANFIPFNDTPTSADWSQSEMSESSTPAVNGPSEWETLRESCAQLEKGRAQRVKDMLSAFSQTMGVICDTDNESAIIAQRSTDLLNPNNMLEEFDQKFGSIERYVPPVVTRVEHASSEEPSRSQETTPTTLPVRRALPEPPKLKPQTLTRSHSSRSQAVKEVSFQIHNTSGAPSQTPRQSPRKLVSVLPLAGTHNCRLPQATVGPSRPPYRRPKLVSAPAQPPKWERFVDAPSQPKLTTNLSSSIFI